MYNKEQLYYNKLSNIFGKDETLNFSLFSSFWAHL